MAGMFRLGSLRKAGVGNSSIRVEIWNVRWCSDDPGGFVSRIWRRYSLQIRLEHLLALRMPGS